MIIASDLEGTLTSGATWRGLASYLKAHGRAADFRRWMLPRYPAAIAYRLNLVDREAFRNRWIADLLALFAGMPEEEFAHVADWVVAREMWPKRRPHVITELIEHADAGHRVIITSGSYSPIVARFARRIGVEEVLATPLEIANGQITGKPGGDRNTGSTKASRLQDYLGGVSPDVAYGDTMADRQMLEMSAQAVAVYPEKALSSLAAKRGWRIVGAS